MRYVLEMPVEHGEVGKWLTSVQRHVLTLPFLLSPFCAQAKVIQKQEK